MPHRRLCQMLACVLLAGCATAPAAPQLAAVAPPPAPTQFDGDYTGVMTGLPGHDAGCRPSVEVHGMHVADGRVSFGSFSGTIGLDGQLQMRSQFEWIMGQFSGSKFSGTLTPQFVGCEYRMDLARGA